MTITSLGTLTAAGLTSQFNADTGGIPSRAVSFQCLATGDPTAIVVDIEASLDGITWGLIDSHTFSAGELAALASVFSVVDKPARFLRANVSTLTFTTSGSITIKGLV